MICLDIAVCSSWGRRLPAHVFVSPVAPKRGHNYCLNCGVPKGEARREKEPCNGTYESYINAK